MKVSLGRMDVLINVNVSVDKVDFTAVNLCVHNMDLFHHIAKWSKHLVNVVPNQNVNLQLNKEVLLEQDQSVDLELVLSPQIHHFVLIKLTTVPDMVNQHVQASLDGHPTTAENTVTYVMYCQHQQLQISVYTEVMNILKDKLGR